MLQKTMAAGLTFGAGAALWGLGEAQAYTLRRRSILIDGGARASFTGIPQGDSAGNRDAAADPAKALKPLRVLHLSDIHLVPWQRHRIKWIQSLAETQPDFLVLTGDQLASKHAVEPLLEALAPFADTPGAFVYGSNDYFGPAPKNPFIYLFRDHSSPHEPHANLVELPWQKMTTEFEARGWISLNNARATARVGGWNVDLVGVDDPHIGRDQFPEVSADGSGDSPQRADLKIGLVHAPYQSSLDQMVADGCTAVFAGHTHGGQVCVPGVGALVTNCDLDREYASGLFQWPPTGKGIIHGDGTVPTGMESFPTAWVNVTTGLGTSPFTPVRVACRPEAVLVEFTMV